MLTFPQIDPVIVSLGPLAVRWYGLMYILGFTAAYLLVRHQARLFRWDAFLNRLDNLNIAVIVGVILGGRLGYVLFYNLPYYLNHPLEILATWQGGMSFHGGGLGVLLALLLCSRQYRLDFWKVLDIHAVTAPIGLGLGRFGNFINGELYGRTTDLPWGMVFPNGGPLPRHPSQLYEALLEGLVLFFILWPLKGKPWRISRDKGRRTSWPHGAMAALFMILYGVFRYSVEFVREPDAQLGQVLFGMTMGQVLSALMAAGGAALWLLRTRKTANPS